MATSSASCASFVCAARRISLRRRRRNSPNSTLLLNNRSPAEQYRKQIGELGSDRSRPAATSACATYAGPPGAFPVLRRRALWPAGGHIEPARPASKTELRRGEGEGDNASLGGRKVRMAGGAVGVQAGHAPRSLVACGNPTLSGLSCGLVSKFGLDLPDTTTGIRGASIVERDNDRAGIRQRPRRVRHP